MIFIMLVPPEPDEQLVAIGNEEGYFACHKSSWDADPNRNYWRRMGTEGSCQDCAGKRMWFKMIWDRTHGYE